MAVMELWTGSAISRGGSLLYIFIAVNASPTVGFLVIQSYTISLLQISSLEGRYHKLTGKLKKFSEQHMLDCVFDWRADGGCAGNDY